MLHVRKQNCYRACIVRKAAQELPPPTGNDIVHNGYLNLSSLFSLLFLILSGLALNACQWVDTVEASLSASGQREIESFINDKLEIVEAMPAHPESRTVFDQVVSLWRYDTGLPADKVAWQLALALPDSPLGMYALHVLLSESDSTPETTSHYYEELLSLRPDSRVTLMALDHHLSSLQTEAEKAALLEETLSTFGNGRLGVFARLRLADMKEASGQTKEAAEDRLLVWLAEPARGPQLYNKLVLFWQEVQAWYWPLLLPFEFLSEDLLQERIQRALDELRFHDLHPSNPQAEKTPRYEAITALRALDTTLMGGDYEQVLISLEELFSQLSTAADLSPEMLCDYGLALFLRDISPDPGYNAAAPEKQWVLQGRLQTMKEKWLDLLETGMALYSADLRAHANLAIIEHYRSLGLPAEAARFAEKTEADPSLSPQWRQKLITILTDIYIQDLDKPVAVAELYERCAQRGTDAASYQLLAAHQYYKLNDFMKASELLEGLRKEKDALQPDEQATVLFLSAMVSARFNDRARAQQYFQTILDQYPDTEIVPAVLWNFAQQAAAAGRDEEYLTLLHRLVEDYPDEEYGMRAKWRLEDIEERS